MDTCIYKWNSRCRTSIKVVLIYWLYNKEYSLVKTLVTWGDSSKYTKIIQFWQKSLARLGDLLLFIWCQWSVAEQVKFDNTKYRIHLCHIHSILVLNQSIITINHSQYQSLDLIRIWSEVISMLRSAFELIAVVVDLRRTTVWPVDRHHPGWSEYWPLHLCIR